MPMDRAPAMQKRSSSTNAAQRRISMRRGRVAPGSDAFRVMAVSATGMTMSKAADRPLTSMRVAPVGL